MEELIKKIKEQIEVCKKKGTIFEITGVPNCKITRNELENTGSTIYRYEYKIELPDGQYIHIDFQSKDKSKSYDIRPDWSCIKITCSNEKFNFSDGWDEN